MKTAQRVIAWFIVFGTLLVWPLLALANHAVLVLGVPSLVLYLFAVWTAIVVVLVLVTRSFAASEDQP
jgi:hypothetical protein